MLRSTHTKNRLFKSHTDPIMLMHKRNQLSKAHTDLIMVMLRVRSAKEINFLTLTLIIIIITYIYHAFINALSARLIS